MSCAYDCFQSFVSVAIVDFDNLTKFMMRSTSYVKDVPDDSRVGRYQSFECRMEVVAVVFTNGEASGVIAVGTKAWIWAAVFTIAGAMGRESRVPIIEFVGCFTCHFIDVVTKDLFALWAEVD